MNGSFGSGYATDTVTGSEAHEHDDANASLVAQLSALYQEKQELQAALGVSTAAEIIPLVAAKHGEGMLGSLTDQLISLYAEHEELQAALGCSNPTEIIAVVKELRGSIRTLVDDTRRRLAYESSILENHERFLA